MIDYLRTLLWSTGLQPHGYCLLWQPALVWTHVISDALIGVSYFSIPIAIAYFLSKRRDIAFSFVIWLFAAFIMACGTTHFMSIWTLWHGDYGVEGLIKAVTAAVSVTTAVLLWPLLPKAIAVPSQAQLQRVNDDLQVRIAERDTALVALERATEERLRAEDMLRQSQKMEAIGQLTGGIAHDFNNVLMIVTTSIERAARLIPPEDNGPQRALANALAGAERAAALTDQLLAFARKQPLQPAKRDLNTIVTRFVDLAQRTLGPGIRVETTLAPDLFPVSVDLSQIENAILNLSVNARDAMPGGGTLHIVTHNASAEAIAASALPPGDYVVLEVSDTGQGMPADVRERAFEPFFTSKPVGQGTGLGLSQVYGFIQQSRGQVVIESEVGAGTTVRIILPRAE